MTNDPSDPGESPRRVSGDAKAKKGSNYDSAFTRVAEKLEGHREQVLRELESSASRTEELLIELPERRRERIRSESRFHLIKICERLQKEGREAWGRDPAAAVELTQLAVEIAERLDSNVYGELLVGDARALAWAYLGNAYRVAAQLLQAERALRRAFDLVERLQVDPLTEAEALVFLASLRNTQGEFKEASDLLDRAVLLYREVGDRHGEARTLLSKGMVLADGGDTEEAMRLIRQGLAQVDTEDEPRLALVAWHNLISCLNDTGRDREAFELLAQNRRLYIETGRPMDLVRLRWLEGKIALGLGELDQAENSLRLARDTFLERGLGVDAAMISFDLALVAAQRQDQAQVARIAAEILPVLRANKVQPDTIAALLMLLNSVDVGYVTG